MGLWADGEDGLYIGPAEDERPLVVVRTDGKDGKDIAGPAEDERLLAVGSKGNAGRAKEKRSLMIRVPEAARGEEDGDEGVRSRSGVDEPAEEGVFELDVFVGEEARLGGVCRVGGSGVISKEESDGLR